MGEGKTFRCEVLTAEAPVLQAEATSAVFPALDGMVGILPDRAPLMAALGKGPVTVRGPGGTRRYLVSGGLACMNANVLTVLADKCEEIP